MLDAILREELTMLIAAVNVLFVVASIACRVGLLYATARRCVVTGDGKANQATVGKAQLLLNQTFSERAATDNGGSVVILHGTSEYLGG